MELSDSLLLDGVKRGEEDAFRILFLRHYENVRRALLRLLDEPAEAEDMAQETFVKLYRQPPKAGREHNLAAWLYRVALNLGHNALRAERRRGDRQLRAAATPAGSGTHDPLGIVLRGEERGLVRQVLRDLPANYQAVLILRYEGLSYSEVAAALQVRPNAVGTMLARAERLFKVGYEGLSTRVADNGQEGIGNEVQ